MKHKKMNCLWAAGSGLTALLGLGLAVGQNDTISRAKGIYVEKNQSGVLFDVVLLRGTERRRVPTSYGFQSGDKMLFQLVLNRESYVYILNRTLSGNSSATGKYAGTKGIQVIRDSDPRQQEVLGEYKLLYPLSGRGQKNLVAADKAQTIPADGTYFAMDRQAGIEKLYIVISPTPLSLAGKFNPNNGDMLHPTANTGPVSGGDDDAFGSITRQLKEWNQNGVTAIPKYGSKGISQEGYGIARNSSSPAMVEVDLRHLER